MPVMRNREERGQRLAEDDEVDGNRRGEGSKRGGAMQELAGMGDLLAQRAVRRVFGDRIFVARRCRILCRGWRGKRSNVLGGGDDGYCLDAAGPLTHMNVGLDNETLQRDGKKREQPHRHPHHGRRSRNRHVGAFAGKLSFSVTVYAHVPSRRSVPPGNLARDALYCQRPQGAAVQDADPKTRTKSPLLPPNPSSSL